eukprot:12247743-Heterocapsa_arctica.AAC.1
MQILFLLLLRGPRGIQPPATSQHARPRPTRPDVTYVTAVDRVAATGAGHDVTSVTAARVATAANAACAEPPPGDDFLGGSGLECSLGLPGCWLFST